MMSQSGVRSKQRFTTRDGISVQEVENSEPGITYFEVVDHDRQEHTLLVIRQVNNDILFDRVAQQIVRYSEREYSPRICDEIRVSTLARYREGENLEVGQCDPMEGRVNLNASPLVIRHLSKSGIVVPDCSISGEAQYAATRDPWVYCTAFCPNNLQDAYRLGKRISSTNNTITKILDVNKFALELGVGFALALEESVHTKVVSVVSKIRKAVLANSGYQRVVHVAHGPVAYEDNSGTLETGDEPIDLASRIGFIKPTSFSYQSEYRFTLGTIGDPLVDPLPIPVSDALRECTSLM